MAYVLPKEISSSVKLTKNLYVFDLVFMGIFMCVVWILNFLVYPPLRTFYYIFMAIMGLYFRSNSSINPKGESTKVYIMLWLEIEKLI